MSAYRALARKYRSRHFGELVGQDVLVRTLSNAIENGRLHHAYMFTGIRGTGKTSTARILAKAINYTGPDGTGKPTIGPTDDCPVCQAIGEDRHPDVVEIDAASNTGVDDVRQIIDNVRYAPIEARYKVFIIDEVHMLSKAAFNALLKTLEEPPPHVVFVLATTEIRKVPTTILSRCQRFDLRRIDVPTLVTHYRKIADAENVSIDEEALYLIAQAADGSARDGLSIFDQAIARSNGEAITADKLRDMLGQANTHNVVELFARLLRGEVAAVLEQLEQLHQSGTDPATFLDDLLYVTHLVTRVKITPALAEDKTLGAAVAENVTALATEFPLSSLSRVWQMLLKAVPEVAQAPRPQQALEMALVRIGFATSLPPLEDLLKKTTAHHETGAMSPVGNNASGNAAASAPVSSAAVVRPSQAVASGTPARAVAMTQPVSRSENSAVAHAGIQTEPAGAPVPAGTIIADFVTLVDLCEQHNEPLLAADLYANVRLHKFSDGKIEIAILAGASKDLVTVLQKTLLEITGKRWIVTIAPHATAATLREQDEQRQQQAIAAAAQDRAVKQITAILPEARIISFSRNV